jgi:hypothetical protein
MSVNAARHVRVAAGVVSVALSVGILFSATGCRVVYTFRTIVSAPEISSFSERWQQSEDEFECKLASGDVTEADLRQNAEQNIKWVKHLNEMTHR